jgi:hypothetical protein
VLLTWKHRYFHQKVTSPRNCQLVTSPSLHDQYHASLGSVTRSTPKWPIASHAAGVSMALMCRVQPGSQLNCGVDPMWPRNATEGSRNLSSSGRRAADGLAAQWQLTYWYGAL